MATWEDLSDYIRANYEVAKDDLDLIQLGFRLGEERTHMVVVSRATDSHGHEWAQVESPVGKLEDIDVAGAIEAGGMALCGGLIAHEGMAVFRHAMPLAELNLNEFLVPMHVVVATADDLEHRFTGADDF